MKNRSYASIHAVSFSTGEADQFLGEFFHSTIGALVPNSYHKNIIVILV